IGPLQHMEIARMRALELGKPLIRSTNNGLTAVTYYKGKIVEQVPQFETALLREEITPTDVTKPYRTFGTWPLYFWVEMSL
ncbi:nitrilase-related carbon-nitrogen hydrolase, partial [Vibrio parahaemolyticus]|uniref:nitrilase-related carbon-nitrogen hydrolase n=1 Tax=Vibrio parahaemolyticus TaxID=670 RepID=UPI00273C01AA